MTSSAWRVADVGALLEIRFSVFFRVSEAERSEPRFEPGIEPLSATIEQLRERCIHQRFEVIGMPRRRAAERVPDIRDLTIFETLEPDISHKSPRDPAARIERVSRAEAAAATTIPGLRSRPAPSRAFTPARRGLRVTHRSGGWKPGGPFRGRSWRRQHVRASATSQMDLPRAWAACSPEARAPQRHRARLPPSRCQPGNS